MAARALVLMCFVGYLLWSIGIWLEHRFKQTFIPGLFTGFILGIVGTFLTMFKEILLRPHFVVTFGETPPYQVREDRLMHVRLRVQNVGRTAENRCEVRLDEVYRLTPGPNQELILVQHDPRALKWAGRGSEPIALSVGAYDLVGLGARNVDEPDNLHVDFGARGVLDLSLDEIESMGFRMRCTVYGSTAPPCQLYFDIKWDTVDGSLPIEFVEV